MRSRTRSRTISPRARAIQVPVSTRAFTTRARGAQRPSGRWLRASSKLPRSLALVVARSHALEREKLAAAREATRLIEPGMTVGLGSGSTVNRLIDVLAESPLDATFVAASLATASAAEQ